MQIGFFTILTLIFIVLKLTNIITWSWLWVLSPMWGGFILFIFTAICIGAWIERRL